MTIRAMEQCAVLMCLMGVFLNVGNAIDGKNDV